MLPRKRCQFRFRDG